MWDQLGLFAGKEDHPRSVSEVTAQIRTVLEQEPAFQNLYVQGEVSNFSRASSGHIYFTLKDENAQLGCVIWRSAAYRLDYMPRSGDQVIAHGYIGVYERGGRYQFYVDQVQPAGRGALYEEFERLKRQLEAEGLFDAARKRPLPTFPRRIGVATSPTTAALRDVINVLRRRYPLAQVLIAPTPVQGEAAPPGIVAALAALNARDDVDVILVVRGGGSIEDLWAFNDERVARAIAGSRIPVVSGVGHETDFTLADFAADVRAPTPSAAAEVVSVDLAEVRMALLQTIARLDRTLEARLMHRQDQMRHLTRALEHLSPRLRLENARQRVDELMARADNQMFHRLEAAQHQTATLGARLKALSPTAVLARGYAIVRIAEDRQVLTSAAQMRRMRALQELKDLEVILQMRDGEVEAKI
ncbi:MAG: exodeoxyribonuclease VII large subunit [Anaerolineales bacterium]